MFITDFRGIQVILKILQKTRQSETAEETQIQCKLEKEFQETTNRQGQRKERITEMIIWKAIRKIRNKKAEERLG